MARPGPFEEMFNLKVGDEMHIGSMPGETIERTLKRIKLRASKYRAHSRSYVCNIDGMKVRVQRVPLDRNKKLWRWEAMKAGEEMILSATPSAKEIRSAQNTAQHLNNKPQVTGLWQVRIDERGLIVRCIGDEEGSVADKRVEFRSRKPSERHRLLELAAQIELQAGWMRKDARNSSPGLRTELLLMAEHYESRALGLIADAKDLKDDETTALTESAPLAEIYSLAAPTLLWSGELRGDSVIIPIMRYDELNASDCGPLAASDAPPIGADVGAFRHHTLILDNHHASVRQLRVKGRNAS